MSQSQEKQEQKKVKIIGLTINERMGILQGCELSFDEKNHLIAIKGEVGSGKTTLQKGLQLGTLGSDVLKDDKQLWGDIDEEVQLLDGDQKIFVGCKSNAVGGLDYVLFMRDENGKKIKDPVIDGVKFTPATYLKNLQTALTWRMDELMSENLTVQKKLLLELYKSELSGLGVVFDKKSADWVDSILGRIEMAENERSIKEFERKSVGGFANQLEPLGIFVDDEATWPQLLDLAALEEQKSKISYQISNMDEVNAQKLEAIKNKADGFINEIKAINNDLTDKNNKILADFEAKKQQYSQNTHTFAGIKTDLQTLADAGCLVAEVKSSILMQLNAGFKNDGATCLPLHKLVQFDAEGKMVAEDVDPLFVDVLLKLQQARKDYLAAMQNKGSVGDLQKELDVVVQKIFLATENNKKCKMLSSFLDWRTANNELIALRNEYAKMLGGINTGVDGLRITVDNEDGKLDIYLTYNGCFDPEYFGNKNGEFRKLSSYSGTQKPLICLLLQNYLLSKLPKAMRYLWIDNVPIDKKTKVLLEKMGEDLDVTIIVNITGDFNRESLQDGEILIEGGQVFFNK